MVQKLAVPIAIVIAGALIAGALYFVNSGAITTPTPGEQPTVAKEIRGVQTNDHIIGNPNARIVLVEYSDTECPFCKQFHQTMHQIVDKYGTDGQVAWVYRHFPLVQLHSKAPLQAQAAECAGELGGEEAFWKFLNRIYEVTPSNDGLADSELPKIAEFAGVDVTAFNACLASDRHQDRIQTDIDEVVASGGRGTPHTILIVDGEQIPLEGAQPFEVIDSLISTLLSE